MLKAEIKPGKEYAFREKRGPDMPLQRVKTIEHIRGNKWKAEWIEPNPASRGSNAWFGMRCTRCRKQASTPRLQGFDECLRARSAHSPFPAASFRCASLLRGIHAARRRPTSDQGPNGASELTH